MKRLDFEVEQPAPFDDVKSAAKQLLANTEDAEREAARIARIQLEELKRAATEGTHARDRKAITIQTTREQHKRLLAHARASEVTLTKLILTVLGPYMREP